MEALAKRVRECGVAAELLLVTEAPWEGVPSAVGPCPVRVIPVDRPTCGSQLRSARDACRGQWLLMLECPSVDDASLVVAFWHRRREADLLIASRYTEGGSYRMPWLRVVISRSLNWLYRTGLSVPVRDLSSARRMYRADLLKRVEVRGDDYDVLMEVLLRFMAEGGRVAELPWHYESREARQAPGAMGRLIWSSLATFGRMYAMRNSVEFPDYDSRAYDSRIWLQRYWQRTRFRIIRAFAGHPDRALDIGCGSSRIIMTRPEMVALDLNLGRLRFLRKTNPRRVQATAGALPFARGAFDVVILSEVIEHTTERNCLIEAARVLRDDGRLIVGTPDYATFWWPVLERIYGWVKRGGYADAHITHYDRQSLFDEIRRAGCEVEDVRYVGCAELIVLARKGTSDLVDFTTAP